MDTVPLRSLMQRYCNAQTDDSFLAEHTEQHRGRVETAQAMLSLDRIPDLTKEAN